MRIIYDPQTDSSTITLRDKRIKESDEVRPGVVADFGYDGGVVRFEILQASKVVKTARVSSRSSRSDEGRKDHRAGHRLAVPQRVEKGVEGMISRRRFLTGATALGAAGLVGVRPRSAVAEPPPETTKLRLSRVPSICRAPQYMTEQLLHSEGFTDVQYVTRQRTSEVAKALAAGEVHITMQYIGPSIMQVDSGEPVVVLAGIQPGCFELFGTERVRSIRDLKGKTVAAGDVGGSAYTFVASMMTYVGLDPRKDVRWATMGPVEAKQLLAEGKIDGFLGLPPDPQELRARRIGHVVVNSVADRPWSQYFCCMVVGHREFVRKNPVATKRTLRAILKAADACAADPVRAARFLVDKGYTQRYDYALQALKEIPYNKWREYNHEDTVRFYSLRLHEAGMIKSNPQKILAQGTDWRFLNELKKELKG